MLLYYLYMYFFDKFHDVNDTRCTILTHASFENWIPNFPKWVINFVTGKKKNKKRKGKRENLTAEKLRIPRGQNYPSKRGKLSSANLPESFKLQS